jgi:hypothetical protein
MSDLKFFSTDPVVSEAFRAVWPNLNKVDKFGKYTCSVDVIDNKAFEETLVCERQQCVDAAQIDLDVTNVPTNTFAKDGIDSKTNEPFRRITFKQNATTKKGASLKPSIVDAHRKPVTEDVWGGSLVKVKYQFLYSIVNGNTNVTLKLLAVQVLEIVNGSGVVGGEEFGDEEGYSAPAVADTPTSNGPTNDEPSDSPDSNGGDF